MGGGISYIFGLTFDGRYWGGCVVGKPRHARYNTSAITYDIRRLACIPEAPKNTESYFIGKVLWWLKKNTACDRVISYSDTTEGHYGGIYKASNFIEIGRTSPTKWVIWNGKRYHPRSLSINRPYSYELRKAVDSGLATIMTGSEKIVYAYDIKRKGVAGMEKKH